MATTITFDIPKDLTPEQVEELTDSLRFRIEGRKSLAADLDRIIAVRASDIEDDPAHHYEFFRDAVLDLLTPMVFAGSAAQSLDEHCTFPASALDRVLDDCHPDEAFWLRVHRESIEATILHAVRPDRVESIGSGRYVVQHPDGSSTPIWEDGLPPFMRDEP